ncbi:hypothetical protein C8R46DRAFT_1356058 [Mycena filopes]|nr:hypothetical protein C8R46DRAFT_1356058 [Mycena filopes]
MARAERTVVPRAMLKYLSCRTSTDAVRDLVRVFDVTWRGILNYKHNKDFATKPPKDFAEALWRIIAVGFSRVEPDSLEEALLVLHGLPDFAANFSAVTLVHATLLSRLFETVTVTRAQWNYALRPATLTELATMLAHPALPADDESLFRIPTPIRLDGPNPTATSVLKECVAGKVKEGYIHLLGDYFHSCGSSTTPYEALETLACIRSTRFSEGLQAMFRDCNNPALLEEVLLLPLFSAPVAVVTPPSPNPPSEQPLRYLHWLDLPSARRTVEETIYTFRPPPSASPALGERWSTTGLMLQDSADAGPGSSISPTDLDALLSFAP